MQCAAFAIALLLFVGFGFSQFPGSSSYVDCTNDYGLDCVELLNSFAPVPNKPHYLFQPYYSYIGSSLPTYRVTISLNSLSSLPFVNETSWCLNIDSQFPLRPKPIEEHCVTNAMCSPGYYCPFDFNISHPSLFNAPAYIALVRTDTQSTSSWSFQLSVNYIMDIQPKEVLEQGSREMTLKPGQLQLFWLPRPTPYMTSHTVKVDFGINNYCIEIWQLPGRVNDLCTTFLNGTHELTISVPSFIYGDGDNGALKIIASNRNPSTSSSMISFKTNIAEIGEYYPANIAFLEVLPNVVFSFTGLSNGLLEVTTNELKKIYLLWDDEKMSWSNFTITPFKLQCYNSHLAIMYRDVYAEKFVFAEWDKSGFYHQAVISTLPGRKFTSCSITDDDFITVTLEYYMSLNSPVEIYHLTYSPENISINKMELLANMTQNQTYPQITSYQNLFLFPAYVYPSGSLTPIRLYRAENGNAILMKTFDPSLCCPALSLYITTKGDYVFLAINSSNGLGYPAAVTYTSTGNVETFTLLNLYGAIYQSQNKIMVATPTDIIFLCGLSMYEGTSAGWTKLNFSVEIWYSVCTPGIAFDNYNGMAVIQDKETVLYQRRK